MDCGTGVPRGCCEERIFEQFYRAQDSLSQSGIFQGGSAVLDYDSIGATDLRARMAGDVG